MRDVRVAVAGAFGQMGWETVQAVQAAAGMQLVACIDRPGAMRDDRSQPAGVTTYDAAAVCFEQEQVDVVVDFTHAAPALALARAAILHGVRPVIGTTGLADASLDELDAELRANDTGGIYAPNFSLGAAVLLRLCEVAAPHFADIEIIEYHHAKKRDKPSGTAKMTADVLRIARQDASGQAPEIPVHSVRMNGFVAHQDVLFGAPGERLSIRHDTMSRASFMPGVLLAIARVGQVRGLVRGITQLLF
jgi:4-hydroxy-tetrahydrodipicolinate reductase